MINLKKKTILSLLVTIFVAYSILSNDNLKSIFNINKSNNSLKTEPVVIIGTGLAGLSAAYEILSTNPEVKVILLEKQAFVGGNSMKASSGINGLFSSIQKHFNIEDSIEAFLEDTTKSASNLGDKKLMEKLVFDSPSVIPWIQEKLGLKMDRLSQLGGHSFPRTHRSDTKLPPGVELIKTLNDKLKAFANDHPGTLIFSFNSNVIDLNINSKDEVAEVIYLDNNDKSKPSVEKSIKTSNVLFATGGFGFSKEMLDKYAPQLKHLPTTNGEQTTGDGQRLLERLGAELIDMDQIQVHPTGFIDPNDRSNNWKFLAAEALRGLGGILLNPKDGKRFVNELETRDVVTNAIQTYCPKDGKAFLVMSKDLYQEYINNMKFYESKGLIQLHTIKTFIEDYNIPISEAELIQELKEYHILPEKSLGRKVFLNNFGPDINSSSELYIGEITPVVHFTMGGVKFNTNSEILGKNNEPLAKGLYGAGEVTGGVHGHNRLGGSSLLECVVFGRTAAKNILKNF
ncbi:hypothetical protein TBLA_0B02110 [Henningerozyma blattae CBS 6284]|uniref:Fumarate reductase n=1 Tax=Henningerozyma blattae (strain ATCC 34711 / CBS 6284 / DSM 70876 / NBRC 10599 / NRRL Y-10934 / UCD 77-7) TaxID=1071380 RepID=I2GY51_HENB6|nr:hypothetical protein TBLA_0B02110 [Tetrapisispora blattae CBS 6284]CCH59053.1 hypothetical protein TBLA_0B02110 [Tetrapisispora blattae CBS 6284]